MTLEAVLLLGAALLAVGLWGALAQQSVVMLMMGLELMLNGVLVSVVGTWYFVAPDSARGQLFAIVVLTLMAVEMALGFALLIAIHRARGVETVDGAAELHE